MKKHVSFSQATKQGATEGSLHKTYTELPPEKLVKEAGGNLDPTQLAAKLSKLMAKGVMDNLSDEEDESKTKNSLAAGLKQKIAFEADASD